MIRNITLKEFAYTGNVALFASHFCLQDNLHCYLLSPQSAKSKLTPLHICRETKITEIAK